MFKSIFTSFLLTIFMCHCHASYLRVPLSKSLSVKGDKSEEQLKILSDNATRLSEGTTSVFKNYTSAIHEQDATRMTSTTETVSSSSSTASSTSTSSPKVPCSADILYVDFTFTISSMSSGQFTYPDSIMEDWRLYVQFKSKVREEEFSMMEMEEFGYVTEEV
jgi:hypothetical protein